MSLDIRTRDLGIAMFRRDYVILAFSEKTHTKRSRFLACSDDNYCKCTV